MPASDPTPAADVELCLDRFVAAFNGNDLDQVMAHFAEDAVYCPGDGKEHRGKEAIRAAFAPQFRGVYGQMTFDVLDRMVDTVGRKAALRWICRHDIGGARGRGVPLLSRLFYRLAFGRRFGWHGTDLFHFDERGKIRGKFTYANYDRPQVKRGLG